jgi:nucleotide-binding universal stress UspA family protein
MKDEPRNPEVVVGVDGSEASIEALRRGQWLASAMNARLVAMTRWDYPNIDAGYAALGIDGFRAGASQILEGSRRDRLWSGGARQPRGAAGAGNAEGAVGGGQQRINDAGGWAHRHSAVGGLLLGPVSSASVAHACCPVLVVHPAGRSGREPAPAGSRADADSV